MSLPVNSLAQSLRASGIGRMLEHFASAFPRDHLKDLVIDEVGLGRIVTVNGRSVVNFGCDSFLGLDQDVRVREALRAGIDRWGSHSGASRAFASVAANTDAEEKLAEWLGVEAAVIFPSVTLVNMGVIPGLVGKRDCLVADEYAHNSIQEGVRLARGAGVRTATFAHDDVKDLERILEKAEPYDHALVCVDGVYSMSGMLPPLEALADVCRRLRAVLYVDDAHGTGVVGPRGIGVVKQSLGGYENTLVVGSLSKAFSCLGGFIGCPASLKRQIKIRSNTYIFGGPVAPCYLEAIKVVVDILSSPEYDDLVGRLRNHVEAFCRGARDLGYEIMGGAAPIVSLFIGDEADTLRAGRFLFDQGYYVQSVIFPAVPYHAGVLRVQLNANHKSQEVEGLLSALTALRDAARLRPAA